MTIAIAIAIILVLLIIGSLIGASQLPRMRP